MPINQIILMIVRFFIERQLKKWGSSLDWSKVKTDLDTRIRQVVPGAAIDDAVSYLCATLVELVAEYFAKPETPNIGSLEAVNMLDVAWQTANTMLGHRLALKALGK
jgi:hypothetical protein